MRRRLVHRAAPFNPQALFSQQLFQSSLGDQRQLPFLDALRVAPDLRRVDTRDERNTFPQQPHVLPVAFHRVAVDGRQRGAEDQFSDHFDELRFLSSFHIVVARQASFSRCVAGLRKNGAVSTVIVSPHFWHDMTETGP